MSRLIIEFNNENCYELFQHFFICPSEENRIDDRWPSQLFSSPIDLSVTGNRLLMQGFWDRVISLANHTYVDFVPSEKAIQQCYDEDYPNFVSKGAVDKLNAHATASGLLCIFLYENGSMRNHPVHFIQVPTSFAVSFNEMLTRIRPELQLMVKPLAA